MKWVNLKDRKPPSLSEAIVRKCRSPRLSPVLLVKNYRYRDDGYIDLWDGTDGACFNRADFEWLDEGEDELPKKKTEWYVGMKEPDGNLRGSGYWKGTIWSEKSDGNFIRIDKPASIKSTHPNGTETYVGMSVRRDTFLSYVDKGWLKKLDEDSAAEFIGKNKNSDR